MLVLGLGKIAQHLGRRTEENELTAFVEQDRLVKHLEKLRAWLVNGHDDDFVMRHPADDLDHVFGIL